MSVHGQDTGPLPVRAGETLLEALLRHGVAFSYACQAGTCGHCRALLLSGRVRMLPHDAAALTPAQAGAGAVLACRSLPVGCVTIAPWAPG